MDLSESMKIALNKGGGTTAVPGPSGESNPGAGYVTEKLYMLLQLYLQNKGWNPSVELLQCFQELKDSPVLPSPAYLQVIANRVNLDSQGRLILRENGKIVLPYEHFGNAVMLKHMQGGPHGIHLSVEQTVRAVMESYTIGRENFGMEKEFIIDVVKSCPNCRYYKNHLGPFMDQGFGAAGHAQQLNPDYISHLQQMAAAGIDITALDAQLAAAANQAQVQANNQPSTSKHSKQSSSAAAAQMSRMEQAQITAAIIQQQNRAMQQQQGLDKNFASMYPMEKQRQLIQHHQQQPSAGRSTPNISPSPVLSIHPTVVGPTSIPSSVQVPSRTATPLQVTPTQSPQVPHPPSHLQIQPIPEPAGKINDFYRSSLESLESMSSSNKDLLALHNGAWANQPHMSGDAVGK